MTKAPHEGSSLIIVCVLETHRVRTQLVVEPWLLQSFRNALVLIQDMPQVLDGGRDDAATAGRSYCVKEAVVCLVLNDRA